MISRLFGSLVEARNALYERGVFKSFSLGAFTVSVGNVTVGGTGKTPLVAFVAELLFEKGEKVCILTRGYGRANPKKRILASDGEKILAGAREAGDEPFELAQKLLGKAVVVADGNRVAAGIWAREKFGITAFVLDDAFQHRRVRRDLDITAIDASNPFGNRKLLPAGILRENLYNLQRAGAIVITRANLCEATANLASEIRNYNQTCPIFVSGNKTSDLISLQEFQERTQNAPKANNKRQRTVIKALAFCALGNPENFFAQLRREDFNLIAAQKFPDHHFYTPGDIKKLEENARQKGAEILLTTAKDAAKLKDLRLELPCFVVENELIFDDEVAFRRFVISALKDLREKANL